MDVKLATLIKSLNIMDVIFSGFTVHDLKKNTYEFEIMDTSKYKKYT